jgi:hypothetical protein
MQKLPRDAYGGEARFTPVQELKQAWKLLNMLYVDHQNQNRFVYE